MATHVLKIGSTNVVELRKLFDKIDAEFLEDATCTFSVKDSDDAAVSGATDLALEKVDGTEGKDTVYRGVLSHSVDLEAAEYSIEVTATSTGGAVRRLVEPAIAED